MGHCSYKGFWSVRCDDETKSFTPTIKTEIMLQKLRELPERFPELFPIPPKSINFPFTDNLQVFTSEDSEEVIKKSAEIIRDYTDFPFIMHYYRKGESHFKKFVLQFMHTPDSELYKFNDQDKNAISFWKLIGNEMELNTTADNLLPSVINNRDHIHMPASEEDFKKAMNEKGGKWILHCSDWETLNNMWKNLIRIYDTGVLVALKSCTSKYLISEINPTYKTKAIMCYTANADCKSCVKRAADSIYMCTGYNFIMYYKSNEASKNGIYQHEGFQRLGEYMYTSSRVMFEKDSLLRWKKINFDNEKHK